MIFSNVEPTQKSRSVKSGKIFYYGSCVKSSQEVKNWMPQKQNNCKDFYEFPTGVLLTIITFVITGKF